MPGFFALSELTTKAPRTKIPRCGACGLYKTCQSPKMPVSGKGRRKVLLVGEAPGKSEDAEGMQFVGESGELLQCVLRNIGIDMRRDCWLTNSLICRPPGNRTPTDQEIDYCQPNLQRTISDLSPDVIVPLGGAAVRSVIGPIWKENTGGINRWAGFVIPCQKPNVWICPTYHPAYLLWVEKDKKRKNEVLERFFSQHLQRAFTLRGKPWKKVPDYKAQIENILDDKEAARIIDSIVGGWIAFDYETNMLKPDSSEALIVSCSICIEGKRTIAFPWHGRVVNAMKRLLADKRVRKIASNAKFEDRWTIKEFGFGVRGWLWDTMLAAHVIDNRPSITSIKFQSFVNLGVESYDDHIKPHLRAKNGTKINQILTEIDIQSLLTYNGMDSVLEYFVALKQMKELGYGRRD